MVRRIPRRLARAPIALYRHGFGWLLGTRFMMLEHRGRTTGRPRYVVLEVLCRRPGQLVLVSGYGHESQWFRNVSADPVVRVWTGGVRGAAARASVLPAQDVRVRLESYRHEHPRAAAGLGRILGIGELAGRDALPADIAERLPLVVVTGVTDDEHGQRSERPSGS